MLQDSLGYQEKIMKHSLTESLIAHLVLSQVKSKAQVLGQMFFGEIGEVSLFPVNVVIA